MHWLLSFLRLTFVNVFVQQGSFTQCFSIAACSISVCVMPCCYSQLPPAQHVGGKGRDFLLGRKNQIEFTSNVPAGVVLSLYVFTASLQSCLLLYIIYQMPISLHAISCLATAGKMSCVLFTKLCQYLYCIHSFTTCYALFCHREWVNASAGEGMSHRLCSLFQDLQEPEMKWHHDFQNIFQPYPWQRPLAEEHVPCHIPARKLEK